MAVSDWCHLPGDVCHLDAQRQWQQSLTARNAAISEYLQAKTRYLILTGRRDDVKP